MATEHRGPRSAEAAADVSDHRSAEEALRESQRQRERQRRLYEAILDNTPDFAYVFDLRHRFIYANADLLKMWGLSWDQAIGKPLIEIGYEAWHAEMHGREIDEVVRTKQPVRGEVPFNGTAGRRIYDYIFVPVFGADGEVEAVAGTTRDVTDRKRADLLREEALASERAARAEAERAILVKDEFLAMLSHELRTPINAIVGWTQILRSRVPNAETLEQGLAVIDRNARMQTQLISDLLDMSRIVSGKMRLEFEPIEFPAIINTALDSVRPAAVAKGIALTSSFSAVPDAVSGDPVRLQQVVWNLASNAVKFTPRGGRIHVALRARDEAIEISVSDSGRGIGPEFLSRVFERFQQADNSTTREYGGLGLGLAIVKQLVELHGGTVAAESDGEGRGATFIVRLPLAQLRAASLERRVGFSLASVTAGGFERPDLSGLRVMVVDDEMDARDLIRRLLEECGALVTTAGAAHEALALVEDVAPDVILSDIGMPERDGYTLMELIRQRGIRTPAAALTAFVASTDRTRALKAGYQTHIAKPVDVAELLATVAALAQKMPSAPARP